MMNARMNHPKLYLIFFLIIVTSNIITQSVSSLKTKDDLNEIKGIWAIDLKPAPNAESYLKEFSIENNEGKSFSGKFYDTNFENSQLSLD